MVWETFLFLPGLSKWVIPHFGHVGNETESYRRLWDTTNHMYWSSDHSRQAVDNTKRDGRAGKRFTPPSFSKTFELSEYPSN
ncbi:hypothetical protein AMTR_s00015p00237200 [Amborella trichopoda]|uniref:Uncharacterized protein n=1 Tax=Amborella trichopoda TaxID=13333 RepID=W1PMI5_AMBTC|nr:hypothetical protein AMTR_s00015p00237200 [Amborella trichopoda]